MPDEDDEPTITPDPPLPPTSAPPLPPNSTVPKPSQTQTIQTNTDQRTSLHDNKQANPHTSTHTTSPRHFSTADPTPTHIQPLMQCATTKPNQPDTIPTKISTRAPAAQHNKLPPTTRSPPPPRPPPPAISPGKHQQTSQSAKPIDSNVGSHTSSRAPARRSTRPSSQPNRFSQS